MNNVITPIFLKASETSRDNFWKCFFQDLSFGIYPSGLFLSNEKTLSCRLKGCEFDYEIPTSVSQLHKTLKPLLKEKLNIESTVKLRNINTSLKCNDIKKNSQKERLLEQYSIDLMNKYGFTIYQTRTIQAFLMLGFQLNVLENDDVQFDTENYSIISINGIDFDNGQLLFTNPIRIEPIKPGKSVTSLRMIELWDKFIKNGI